MKSFDVIFHMKLFFGSSLAFIYLSFSILLNEILSLFQTFRWPPLGVKMAKLKKYFAESVVLLYRSLHIVWNHF